MYLFLLIVLAIFNITQAHNDYHESINKLQQGEIRNLNIDELDASFWNVKAQDSIANKLGTKPNTNVAKNIILFLGDGMSIQTLAPARILLGQRDGRTGEESVLSFEKFPSVGLVKTYCVNHQIPDSACTATAFLGGVKGNLRTIGVSAHVAFNDCNASLIEANRVESLAAWAIDAGKDAGIVTTTRISHASPAGAFAKVASRSWETDADVTADGEDPLVCRDIAYQLIHEFPGKDFKVIIGGGRRSMLPVGTLDEENYPGRRTDGRNLTDEWISSKNSIGATNSYVWDRQRLLNVDTNNTEYILGLFEGDHLRYNMLTNHETEPTLEELTEVAVKMLRKSANGYFLFVEGGRIDHGHHDNQAHLSLDETIEFQKAVQKAVDMTYEEDTLIVVTSDHSHVMTFNGYTSRGSDILGPSLSAVGNDGVPYMTLSYTNGPGFKPHASSGVRQNPSSDNYHDPEWMYPAEVPLNIETHGGEDIAVFAKGPYSHLFTGVYEQNEIPHLMAYASCVGPGLTACTSANSAFILTLPLSLLIMTFTIVLVC